VLGDPGTGKSVAMRKLARDLIAESGRSARIPIYVNLKEWRRQKSWTAEDKPTAEEFYKFLFYSVLENLDYASRALLQDNENYHRLFEAGYFFFILDSFDEIPAVLDHDEKFLAHW
jgi:predicted NACHT family NTPase